MIARRAIGFALLSIGLASTAYAGGRYAVGSWRQAEARRLWDEAEARAVVAQARETAAPNRILAGPVRPGAPIARLVIPRLGLDEIVVAGVHDAALNAGPGHLPGSALPGEAGNAVISAHRDRHFSRLGEVQVGDTVMTETGLHRSRWVVVSKKIVDDDAPALFRTSRATLTLTTCWPIRYFGTAPDRLLVTARLVGPPEVRSFASVQST